MGLDLGGLLKGGIHRAGELIEQPFQVTRDIIKDPKHGFDTLKKIPGQNERNDSKMLSDGGIGGWVGKHPQETAGAVVASIFGGAAMLGGGAAAGAGAGAGGAAGSAGAAGTGAGAMGGVGASAYMAPAAGGGVATTGGGALASSAPATSSLLGMGHAGVGAAGSTAGASSFTPAMLTTQGAAASGGTYGAASAPASASALGTVPASTSGAASSGMSAGDWSNVSRILNSVKQPEEEQQRVGSPQMSPAYRANFRGNKMDNSLLTKTMQDIYNSPTYSPLRLK